MTCLTFHTRSYLLLIVLCLSACGGGGGGNDSPETPAEDRTPDAFSFDAQTDVGLAASITSNPIVVAGINVAVPISIDLGEYAIDGGDFTDQAATIEEGQVVEVRLTASDTANTPIASTLTVGSVSAEFSVTTSSVTASDTTPDTFSFETQNDVEASRTVSSNSIIVSGIDAPASITIVGGLYAIDDATFTAQTGTITQGQRVTIQITASDAPNTTSNATLTIGGVSADFTITTEQDEDGGAGGENPPTEDTTPDAFSFEAQSDQNRNTLVTSNGVTIVGINAPAAISIVGGEYAIDGGVFTSEVGLVQLNQTVVVRLTSAEQFSRVERTTLSIGGVSADFDVTTLAADTIPNAFSFADQTDVTRATRVASEIITITGINTTSPINISNGEYAIDGGSFTAEPSTIEAGQSVQVRITSDEDFAQTASATLTVGTVSATFTVTTLAADTIPSAFSFADQTDVALATRVASEIITITAINTASPINISNGEYAIDGGSFTAESSTIEAGQNVQVRVTSGEDFAQAASATLTVGTVSATFTVTTLTEASAPTANIVFPPESALVNKQQVRVRGTASDAQNDQITSVRVNGVDAESDDGFATWQVIVPLDLGENTLVVSTSDNQQNVNDVAATTTVQARALPFLSEPSLSGIEIDSANNRALVIDSNLDALFAFDLSTGQRTVISSNLGIDDFNNPQAVGSGTTFRNPEQLVFDAVNNRVLFTELLNRQIVSVDINTGVRSVFFDMNNSPGSGPALRLIRNSILDAVNNRILIIDGFDGDLRLFAINLTDERRTLISSNASIGPILRVTEAFHLDAANNRVLIVDASAGSLLAIDLDNGARTVLSGLVSTDDSVIGNGPNFVRPLDVDIDTSRNQALVSDAGLNAVVIVDLASGNRSLLTGSGPGFIDLQGADYFGDNHIVAVDGELETSMVIDRTTGDRALLPNNSIGEGPRLETPRSLAQLNPKVLLVADSEANALFHVDLSNGSRSILIDANDSILNRPKTLALDKTNQQVWMIDNVNNNDASPRLLSLDLASEALRVVSGDGVGTGPEMTNPEAIALDSGNNRMLVTDSGSQSLLAINLATGERSIISDGSSQGVSFNDPAGIAVNSAGDTAFVVNIDDGILFSVNLQTGARTIVSGVNPDTDEVIGTEFALEDSLGLALDEVNNRALITNADNGDLFAVDLNTGIAREITDSLSIGPSLEEPVAVVLDEHDNTRAYVIDSSFRALFTVDLTNGDRVLTSWSEVSPQNNLF